MPLCPAFPVPFKMLALMTPGETVCNYCPSIETDRWLASLRVKSKTYCTLLFLFSICNGIHVRGQLLTHPLGDITDFKTDQQASSAIAHLGSKLRLGFDPQ